jgi:AraC family transcriptional regulator
LSAEGYRVVARAARARTLLDSTDVPLAEIAWRLGYSDQSHLHRQVLAHSGYTPTAWRERGREWHVSRVRTD